MLVLSRKLNEKIVLPTLGITVQVVSISRGAVRIGIEAPPEVPVLREELQTRQAEWQPPSPASAPNAVAERRACERLQKLTQMLSNRMKVTGVGLKLLRHQVEEGELDEMVVTIEKLTEDLTLLRRRLDAAEGASPARGVPAVEESAALRGCDWSMQA
jgi:carbon storage regulator CsrA